MGLSQTDTNVTVMRIAAMTRPPAAEFVMNAVLPRLMAFATPQDSTQHRKQRIPGKDALRPRVSLPDKRGQP